MVFHGSRSGFMIFQGFRSVFYGFYGYSRLKVAEYVKKVDAWGFRIG